MAIGGAFLGGGAEVVPAGSCKLELEILTEDRANLTATFTIKGTSTYTVTAGADGRAVYTVPAGQTYTVSVNTTGYDNIASQTVIAESGTVRYVRFEAFSGRVKRSGDTMTGTLAVVGGASIDTNGQVVGKKLRATADIHLGSSPSSYAVVNDGWIQNRTLEETKADLGINGKQDKLTAGTNITISGTTISAKDTTYDVATQSANGLMSSTDKTKLDGVDSALAGKVSKSGDTMRGVLTLNTNTNLKSTVRNIGNTGQYNQLMWYLSDSATRTALVAPYRFADRDTLQILTRRVKTDGTAIGESRLELHALDDGTAYATAPSWSVGTNDNSDKILTIKMANSLPSLMHTTGNESIAGDKTFEGHIILDRNNSHVQYDTIVTTWMEMYSISSYNDTSNIHTFRTPQGTLLRLNCKNKNSRWVAFDINNPDDGDPYCAITTSTPSTATTNEIVTADWALNKFQRKITYGTGDPPSGGQAGDIYIKI